MLPEDCDNCFNEIQGKIDHLVNVARNSIISMNNEHKRSIEKRESDSETFFIKQEEKYDKYLERREKREAKLFNINIGILGFLSLVIGYLYVRQGNMEDNIELKANRNEVPTMNEIRMLRELGDQYNKSVFVKKDHITADTSAYFWSKKNIYGSELRSANKQLK